MNILKNEAALMGLALLAGGAMLWWATRPGVARQAGEALAGAVGDVATGTVIGAGKVVGIPATQPDQCAADMAAGRWWDASFSCPAGTFVKGAAGAAWNSVGIGQSTRNDADIIAARGRVVGGL